MPGSDQGDSRADNLARPLNPEPRGPSGPSTTAAPQGVFLMETGLYQSHVVVIDDQCRDWIVNGRPLVKFVFYAFAAILCTVAGIFISRGLRAFDPTGEISDFWQSMFVFLACVLFNYWIIYLVFMFFGSVLKPNASHLFLLKGASISVAISVAVEMTWQVSDLAKAAVEYDRKLALIVAMVMVGMIEEVGKFAGLVYMTSFSASHLPASLLLPPSGSAGCMRNFQSCFSRSFTCLITSKRALTVAGIATGCGFMIVENGLVFMKLCEIPLFFDGGLVAFAALFRSLVNLHPMWTGLTAARLACFHSPAYGMPFKLNHIVWSLWPSIVLHALWDASGFLMLGSPVAILVMIGVLISSCVLLCTTYQTHPVERVGGSAPTVEMS